MSAVLVLDDSRIPGTDSAIPSAPDMAAASDGVHTACTPDIEFEFELVDIPLLVCAEHAVSTDTVSVEELCMSLLSLILLGLLSLQE